MNEKYARLGKVGILIGGAIAAHSLGSPESAIEVGLALGISTDIAQGIFAVASEIFVEGAFENLIKLTDKLEGNEFHDLNKVILDSYDSALQRVEKDILEKLEIKENRLGFLKRVLIKQTNRAYENKLEIKESFIEPILDALTSDEVMIQMIKEGGQLDPDLFLKAIIKRTLVWEEELTNIKPIDEFVDWVCSNFKKYFRQSFLLSLRSNDNARRTYFTHLLEEIILNTRDINRDMPLIRDFAVQINLKLTELAQLFSATNKNIAQINFFLEKYEISTSRQLFAIEDKLQQMLDLKLNKRDSHKALRLDKDSNKFDFKYRYLNFVGRTEEMSRLWTFLGRKDDENKFLWWMITGPGGMGKSRIAQNLCLMDDGYYSGFLEINTSSTLQNLELWAPVKPTLIIIDYALAKIDRVVELITTFQRQSGNFLFPVRLILLDRKETDEWKIKLRPGTEINDSLYLEGDKSGCTSMELSPLTSEDDWRIVEQVIQQEAMSNFNGIKKDIILESINLLNADHRPLFTFLIAMAIVKGDNVRDWNIHDLLENTLLRFEYLWTKYHSNNITQSQIKRIFFVNTFCEIISPETIESLILQVESQISYEEFKDLYVIVATLKVETGNASWEGLQPDLLGEFFILKTIANVLDNNPMDGVNIVLNLIKTCWQLNSKVVCDKTLQMWQDFPDQFDEVAKRVDLFDVLYQQISVSNEMEARQNLSDSYSRKNNIKLFHILYNRIIETKEISTTQNSQNVTSIVTISFDVFHVTIDEMNKLMELEKDYDRAVNLNPKNQWTFLQRGIFNVAVKRYQNAWDDYTTAIKIDDSAGLPYFQRGMVSYWQKKYKEAIEDFDKAVQAEPMAYAFYYYQRGRAKGELNRYLEALDDFNISLQLDADDLVVLDHKALALFKLNHLQEAMQIWNQIIEVNSDYPDAYGGRAVIYIRLKQFENAVHELNTAIKLVPESPVFYTNRGLARTLLGQFSAGIEDYTNAIKFDSPNGELYYERGRIFLLSGDRKAALKDFRLAMDRGLKDAEEMYDKLTFSTTPRKIKKISRNKYITVKYITGEVKDKVKYKDVLDDINSGKCIVL